MNFDIRNIYNREFDDSLHYYTVASSILNDKFIN